MSSFIGSSQDPEKDTRPSKLVIASIGLHLLLVVFMVLIPLLNTKKTTEITVMNLVNLEPPKIRVRKQKKLPPPKPPEKKVEEPDAPELVKKAIPKKPKKPEKVKVKEDTVKTKEEPVEEVVEDIAPKMVSAELSDPRLKFWGRRVLQKIQRQWNPPGGLGIVGGAIVRVTFTVLRSGEVEAIGVGTSSGHNKLDELGTNTMERVGKLPPIPPNYREKDQLTVTVEFHYSGH